MIYIASPYSHPNAEIMMERYHKVILYTGLRLSEGVVAFSPIVHCHSIAVHCNLPINFEFWKNYNFGMLKLASSLEVLTIQGWDESAGVKAEIEFAYGNGIPTRYVTL